jgi:hypothetical protein
MTSLRFSDVDWSCYAPGMQRRVRLTLERGKRVIGPCLLCRKPKRSTHVYLPAEAETLGGSGIQPCPYGLCAAHEDADIATIASALGLAHTLPEVNHAQG